MGPPGPKVSYTLTKPAGSVLASAIALEVLAQLTGSRWLQLLACLTGALLIVSWFMLPKLKDVTVSLSPAGSVRAGGPLVERVLLTNTGRHLFGSASVLLVGQGRQTELWWTPPVAANGKAAVVGHRQVGERGLYGEQQVVLSCTDPLGLVGQRTHLRSALPLVVWPQLAEPFPLPRPVLRRTDLPGGRAGAPVGLREYRPGDAAREISPRASARRGSAVVIERQREALPGPLLLVVPGPGEPGLARLSATGEAALSAGRDVGLLWQGRDGQAHPLWVTGPHQLLDAMAAITDPVLPDPRAVDGMRAEAELPEAGGGVLVLLPTPEQWWPAL